MRLWLLRRLTQLSTIAMLIAIPMLNKKGINALMGSLYSVAIGPLWITDPLSGLQVILTTLSADSTLLVSMAIPILFALVFGRVFCGWMCPQNAISELFDFLSRKIGVEQPFRLPLNPMPRYAVLAVMLTLTMILGFPVANLISAPGIISVQMSDYCMTGTVGVEVGLIGVIVFCEIFIVRRGWCSYICPVGAFLGIFRISKTMMVDYRKETDQCIKCGECIKTCQLGLNPMGGMIYPLCHNCGDCITACRRAVGKDNPLSFKV
jgi:ferredoxin-type protein NapH